jgi:hypothetical protein
MTAKAKVLGASSGADVRAYFRGNKKALKALSEAAQANVRPQDEGRTVRGRLHPEAIEAFDKAHPDAPYTTGEGVIKNVTLKGRRFNKSGTRRIEVTMLAADARDALRLADIEVGERGIFSASQTEALEAMLVL